MIRRPLVGRVIGRHLSYKQTLLSEPYEPAMVEVQSRLYEDWNDRGLFNPDTQPCRRGAEPFVMCLPPPNVTGDLHIGHALAFATEDALGRWHRMRGQPVLLLPGTDHAGIATQAVVERQLVQRRTSRLQLGREGFVREVEAWSEEKQRTIRRQIERLGVSADWSRQFFTLDPARSTAVSEAFRRLHASGRIFRGQRIVNFCCALRSVISDIEVESYAVNGPQDLQLPGFGALPVGRLHLFAYRLEPQGSQPEPEIVVATTRLETMLGDSAIAVHPSDTRYSHLIGRRALHPFLPERRLAIVADESVEPEAGTGAVKVTPAHSAPDFLIGQRHRLDVINILNDDGSLNASAGEQFEGLSRLAARSAVQVGLEALGLYRGWRPHAQVLPLCSRTGDLVEPLLRPQWFLRCSGEMAGRALDAVATGELCIRPSNYAALWEEWMSKCEDWCISRQLWWGHRVPAWRHVAKDEWRVPGDPEEEHQLRESSEWQQDEDVLDTWFSSALLPLSALGWPNPRSRDLAAFFPNSALETGVDILFFWVARMVMLGLELSGQLPFREVVLHGLVCDRAGQKMSKSKGNVVDPLTIMDATGKLKVPAIKALGADALRASLLAFNTRSLHLNFAEQEVLKQRKFGNKVWNSLRFVAAALRPGDHLSESGLQRLRPEALPPVDRWMLQKITDLVSVCEAAMEQRQLHTVVKAVPAFWLNTFSPVFLEVVKPRLKDTADEANRLASEQVLFLTCDILLRLLHPVMPFLTEFAWRALLEIRPGPLESLAVAPFPSSEALAHFGAMPAEEVAAVDASLAACEAVRSWRVRLKVPRAELRHSVAFECSDARLFQVAAPLTEVLCRVPLLFKPELPPARAEVLELPVGPGARLLVQREKAQPQQLILELRRSLEKLHKEEAAALSAENAYEIDKVRRRIHELDSDLTLLMASMQA